MNVSRIFQDELDAVLQTIPDSKRKTHLLSRTASSSGQKAIQNIYAKAFRRALRRARASEL